MHWVLVVDHKVVKQLARFPNKDKKRLTSAILALEDNPFTGDIEKMNTSEESWRRRLGAYRIFYDIHISKKYIHVYDVQRRSTTTY